MRRHVAWIVVPLFAAALLTSPAFADDDDLPALGIMFKSDENTGKPVVVSAIDGSPAAKAGLKEGDVIVKVGDTAVDNLQAVVEAVKQLKVGTKAKITVLRDNQEKTIEITPVKRKDVFPKQ